ncbi:3-methyladenine DNA glycosylase [Microterricola viridarii]|uniref:3-methyladenine DNA glycosylase n=1 Tax=Microterricola viridarii TaxID=412690 RepID=A0A0Y0NZF6_9MICO|nr:3-methyladenine DNA glycosylase [Microterricola viridarii]AMB60254.1 3-methyladenine DNA glycosylase [Microterricola viridarii]
MPTAAPVVLAAADWRALEAEHAERADALTLARRERVQRGETHPVEDFLFTYYPNKPSALRRWHPGAGVVLAGAAGDERADWRWYRADASGLQVDAGAFLAARGATVDFIERLLGRTKERQARFGCFGLHEWAMVYKQGEHRHEVPLRLGQAGTDAVVEAANISCTHFDAYRFFTPEALPLNALRPSRENQPELEQSGCLHAGMDLYKWAVKLGPLVPGELLLDTFDLARDIRWLDMAASPYDVSDWGAPAVAIETAEGKAEYVRAQRGFAERGDALRVRLVAAIAHARGNAAAG